MARTSKKRTRKASRPRKSAANAIKNMHVPAYWPVVVGVHAIEKSGVLVEVKKVMAIESIPIIDMESMVSPAEVAIGMPGIVVLGEPEDDIGIIMFATSHDATGKQFVFFCRRWDGGE